MAQEKYHTRISTNFGMSARHSEDELPYSRNPIEFPERVAKVNAGTRLLQDADGNWSIVGGWDMADADQLLLSENSIFSKDFDTSSWYNATVPGTVLTTLVNQGVYPDPYYGVNNMAIPESLCRELFSHPESGNRPRMHLYRSRFSDRSCCHLRVLLAVHQYVYL